MHITESPMNEPNYSKYNGMFNATWTYSKKSDITTQITLDYFSKRSSPIQINKNYAEGKTKFVAWFVSNCRTSSKRLEYVNNLKKHIPVHIYGNCGQMRCTRTHTDTNCMTMLKKQYKFYLSFENNICIDYVTEKMWTAIYNDVIPVVLGGANYSSQFPPQSYIDIKDFKSPKQLAEYLLMLDEDDAKYNGYFRWKGLYSLVKIDPLQCILCEYVNKYHNTTKIYDRLDLHWNRATDCFTPQQYYKTIDKKSWY